MNKLTLRIVSPLFFAVFLAVQLHGQSLTLSLNNVPEDIECNEVWTEQDLNLSFVNTTSDDCGPGACSFAASGPAIGYPESVMLWPSRLTVDLSSLEGIQAVEIDIVDYCGLNCTRAYLSDNDGVLTSMANWETGVSETFILDNLAQTSFTELAVSSCEGGINEIRIYQNTNTVERQPSATKKLLRIVDSLGRDCKPNCGQLLFYMYDDGSVEKKVRTE